MLPKQTNPADLERAYAVVAQLEQELAEASADQRLLFFTEVQAEMSDRNIPKFDKGATMSQAFRMGMEAGVECTMNAIDRRDVIVLRDETWLNVVVKEDGPDIVSMSELWANHINS